MLTGTLSPVSNRADWIEAYGLYDADTDEPIDISDATEIIVEIKDKDDCFPLLSASLTNATIERIQAGVFQWMFSAIQMRTLCIGTYPVKLRITKDEIETQLFIGYLPVLNG